MKLIPPLTFVLTLTSFSLAQTPISGPIYDGAGGPLLAGTVYHATGNIQVPAGQTLTVQAGAIVKLNSQVFSIDGTLKANGTSANRVIFTSIHDDAAGGDTNGNGNATVPAPDQWYGLIFTDGSDASTMSYTTVRYTGAGFSPAVLLLSADMRATDCTFSDGNWGGMNLSNNSKPTVSRATFARFANYPAVFGVPINSVPGFSNNTATSNAGGNYLRVDATTVAGNLTIEAIHIMNGALVVNGNLQVPTGSVLTLNAGCVLKTNGQFVTIDGTLRSNGTAANSVVFTSIHDDAAGGDTNGNGNATLPAPDQWYGLIFNDGADASTMSYTTVRYVGAGFSPAVALNSADITATDCTFSDGNWGGMNLSSNSKPTVSRATFARFANYPAVFGVPINSVPGFSNNTATSNAGGNYLRVDATTVAGNLTIDPIHIMNGALVVNGNLQVPTGSVLTLNAGCVLKANGQFVTIDGTLRSNGTAANSVVFTSIHDDASGGDTNGNGNATLPAPDQWYGLIFNDGADASTMSYTTVRYVGAGFSPAVALNSADITATDCTFSDGNWGGMNLTNNSKPTVSRATFARFANYPAVFGVPINSVPAFSNNTATSNAGGNYLRVDATTVAGNLTIDAINIMNGALVYNANVTVPTGASLTLTSGVIVKARSPYAWSIDGTLNVQGPVVFTSFPDDVYGGDTNGDGPSTGAPDQWYGLSFGSGAGGAIRQALVRYTGAAFSPAISCDSPNVAFRASRVEFGNWGGFFLTAAAVAEDLVAFGIGSDGFRLSGGTFDLQRVTSAYNAGIGITRTPAWSGRVRSSIAFNNNGGDFGGFAAGDVLYSNGGGITGGTGNTNLNPQFVNSSAGDLRLQSTSPCVDSGDPLDTPTGLDVLGFPRFLDGNLDGTQRVDKGANEYDNLLLLISGTPTPGSTLTFTTLGNPIMNPVFLFVGVGQPLELPLLNLGSIFVNLTGPYVALAWPGPGSSVPVPIPAGLQTPVQLVFQEAGLNGTPNAGNTSNPVFLTIQ